MRKTSWDRSSRLQSLSQNLILAKLRPSQKIFWTQTFLHTISRSHSKNIATITKSGGFDFPDMQWNLLSHYQVFQSSILTTPSGWSSSRGRSSLSFCFNVTPEDPVELEMLWTFIFKQSNVSTYGVMCIMYSLRTGSIFLSEVYSSQTSTHIHWIFVIT